MKKIYLSKVQQFNDVSYTGSVDPRKLVRMVDQSIEIGQVQEDQRPLDKKHIQEIAEHVGNQGLLPTSIIVGTKDTNKLVVETETSPDGNTLYYMMIPDTDDELKQYENTIDISDGQHNVRNPLLPSPVPIYIFPPFHPAPKASTLWAWPSPPASPTSVR